MVLRERIRVNATAGRVWAILGDPSLMELWNPKCVRCHVEEDRVRLGLRFKAAFRLKGAERETDCEVLDCRPDQVLTIRFSGSAFRGGGYVDETFRLCPVHAGTEIIHEVDFAHSGLPRLLKALMKVLDLVGHKQGKSSLDCLRELTDESH